MLFQGVTLEEVQAAAAEVGVRLAGDYRRPEGGLVTSRGVRACLRTAAGDVRRVARYGRFSAHRTKRDGSPSRIPGAVCWHGHRDFMRALFRRCPGAVIVTALATYRGSEDFERSHAVTEHEAMSRMGHRGAPASSVPCDCDTTPATPVWVYNVLQQMIEGGE